MERGPVCGPPAGPGRDLTAFAAGREAMPTLQVPGLNIQLPLDDLEEERRLAEMAPPAVEAAARHALLQWLGGMAEVAPGTRWDATRVSWVGAVRYLEEEYQWLIR